MARSKQEERLRQIAIILALALALVLSGVVLGALAFTIAPVSGADTQTHTAKIGNWIANGVWGGTEQLLDAPQYVSGFHSDARSEIIVAQGQFTRPDIGCNFPSKYDYQFWFKSYSGDYSPHVKYEPQNLGNYWKDLGDDGWSFLVEHSANTVGGTPCGSSVGTNAAEAQVAGNFIGVLRVKLWGYDSDLGGWRDFATDEANVQPGWGVLSIENADSLIEVGENLRIHYDVGAACSSKDPSNIGASGCGWKLSVRNRETGATPSGWTDRTIGDYAEQTISVTVAASWFTIGQHNEYEVKLFNQLNLQDAKLFVTIDDKTLAPGTPKVTVTTDPPYHQNDLIEVTALSEPNKLTNASIKEYHFIVRQGQTILFDERQPGGAASFTITDEQIDVKIEVTAFDGSRTSGVGRVTLTVANTDLDNTPPPPGTSSLPWGLILILAGAIAVLVGLAVDMDWRIRLAISGAGVAMLVAGVVIGVQLPKIFPWALSLVARLSGG